MKPMTNLLKAMQSPNNLEDAAYVASVAANFFASGSDSKVRIAVVPRTENFAKELGIDSSRAIIVGHKDLVDQGREIVPADTVNLPPTSTGIEPVQGFDVKGYGDLTCAQVKVGTVGAKPEKNVEVTQKCVDVIRAYLAGRGMEMRPAFNITA